MPTKNYATYRRFVGYLMKKLLRRFNRLLTKWLDEDQTEEEIFGLFGLVLEWLNVPGTISFEGWLAKQVLELRAALLAAQTRA